jgi:hypothetical protein
VIREFLRMSDPTVLITNEDAAIAAARDFILRVGNAGENYTTFINAAATIVYGAEIFRGSSEAEASQARDSAVLFGLLAAIGEDQRTALLSALEGGLSFQELLPIIASISATNPGALEAIRPQLAAILPGAMGLSNEAAAYIVDQIGVQPGLFTQLSAYAANPAPSPSDGIMLLLSIDETHRQEIVDSFLPEYSGFSTLVSSLSDDQTTKLTELLSPSMGPDGTIVEPNPMAAVQWFLEQASTGAITLPPGVTVDSLLAVIAPGGLVGEFAALAPLTGLLDTLLHSNNEPASREILAALGASLADGNLDPQELLPLIQGENTNLGSSTIWSMANSMFSGNFDITALIEVDSPIARWLSADDFVPVITPQDIANAEAIFISQGGDQEFLLPEDRDAAIHAIAVSEARNAERARRQAQFDATSQELMSDDKLRNMIPEDLRPFFDILMMIFQAISSFYSEPEHPHDEVEVAQDEVDQGRDPALSDWTFEDFPSDGELLGSPPGGGVQRGARQITAS